jgi:hypothetical protein
VTGVLPHNVQWVTAAPLWPGVLKTPTAMRRPTILGFTSDSFMEDLLADLARKPEAISARVATGHSPSYREREPGEPLDAQPTTKQLKLYQPLHGCFYLVTGSLVCQLPGLPDHSVDPGLGERAGFVLRRIAGGGELALVVGADGKKSWQAVPDVNALREGEEILPLFPLGFLEKDRRRRMMAGVIPAGSQDLLQAAPVSSDPDAGGKPDPADALEDIKARVTGAITLLQDPDRPPTTELGRETSRFILMDLADFLSHQLPAAWQAIRDGGSPGGKVGDLVSFLRAQDLGGKSLADHLKTILDLPLTSSFNYNLAGSGVSGSTLQDRLEAAVKQTVPEAPTALVPAEKASATEYVTRLVYQRPRCLTLHRDVVSQPSEPFVLAPFFDPDAPGRPIRIALPIDPSIKGLRQFRKNVKLVMSQALRDKVKNIGKINDSVEGPGFDCGGLSLSIPIITIVAMIILFIFLNLLNIVFWWLPFVKICFPKVKVEL